MPTETVEDVQEQAKYVEEMQRKYGVTSVKGFPFLLPERLRILHEKIQRDKLANKRAIEESTRLGQAERLEDLIVGEQKFHIQETIISAYGSFIKEIDESFTPRIEKLQGDLRNLIGYVSERAEWFAEHLNQCVTREQMLELEKIFVEELKHQLTNEEAQIKAMLESDDFKKGKLGKIAKKKRKR